MSIYEVSMQKYKVRLITHTGSDLSLEEAERLGVRMIPDYVVFDEEIYRNKVDLTAEEFYEKMERSEHLPTSSHPSVGDFAEVIREEAEGAEEILCLMITSKMSGTLRTVTSSAVSRVAHRISSTSFFAPIGRISPLNLWPPSITNEAISLILFLY